MDKELLVKQGHELIKLLADTRVSPQFSMWVLSSETDSWKLWIMPSNSFLGEKDAYRSFYRIVSDAVQDNQAALAGLSAGSINMVDQKNPAVSALRHMFKSNMPNLRSAYLGNNKLNGFYMLDGIILLNNFESRAA